MRRMTYFVMALAMVLGFSQCKKEQTNNQDTEGHLVPITLNVGGINSRVNVNPTDAEGYASVNFESGDVIYVGFNNKCVGTLTYNGSNFSGQITLTDDDEQITGQPLHFYFLGGVGFTPTVNNAGIEATVVISDQSSKYPVISYSASDQTYPADGNAYSAVLKNKVSIMKFNVTTPSNAAICLKGLNNQVTVNFATNTFGYDQVNDGLITMPAVNASGVTWAIVLPQTAWDEGADGTAYTADGIYTGVRPNIDDNIGSNQYLNGGVNVTLNTYTEKGTPLTFEAMTAGAVVQFDLNSVSPGKVQFSCDGITWETYTDNASITLINVGDKVMFRGNWGKYDQSKFTCSADCYVYGNVNSLQNTSTYPTLTNLGNRAFYGLFNGNTHIKNHATKDIVLPATTLGDGNCYNSMFKGCTGLTRVPKMNVTTLGNYCFQSMFEGCTGLTSVPSDYLPAETLTDACYMNMFKGCTGLTSVPNLPAMTASPRCYSDMFNGCTSLTSVPADLLPATTLADIQEGKGCYEKMFYGCSNLTSAPTLPAETLTGACYRYMFDGCTSLTSLTCLVIDHSATDCTRGWLNEVPGVESGSSGSGTFYCNSSISDVSAFISGWFRNGWGIPYHWTVQKVTP